MKKTERFCCYIGLFGMRWEPHHRAEWCIEHGTSPDDFTDSCSKHLGAMMTDAPEHRIYPITQERNA